MVESEHLFMKLNGETLTIANKHHNTQAAHDNKRRNEKVSEQIFSFLFSLSSISVAFSLLLRSCSMLWKITLQCRQREEGKKFFCSFFSSFLFDCWQFIFPPSQCVYCACQLKASRLSFFIRDAFKNFMLMCMNTSVHPQKHFSSHTHYTCCQVTCANSRVNATRICIRKFIHSSFLLFYLPQDVNEREQLLHIIKFNISWEDVLSSEREKWKSNAYISKIFHPLSAQI
jgi:hypothetical protein